MSLFLAALFYVLTPGVYLRLPRKGSKTRVALTHALVFALIYYLTNKIVLHFLYRRERFADMKSVDQGAGSKDFAKVGAVAGSARHKGAPADRAAPPVDDDDDPKPSPSPSPISSSSSVKKFITPSPVPPPPSRAAAAAAVAAARAAAAAEAPKAKAGK